MTERDEIDAMLRDLVAEQGLHMSAYAHKPDNVDETERKPVVAAYPPGQLESYRQAQQLRRKLMGWLKRHPEWVAAWRAERELDGRIEAVCKARGLRFRPWETPPWRVDSGPCPYPAMSAGARSWPQAQRLRSQLIAELEAGAA